MRKLGLSLGAALLVWVIGCVPMPPSIQAVTVDDDLGAKWLDVSVGPETVAWFNLHAQPQDIARIDHMNMLNLLDELTTGQRLVVVKSIAEAEQVLTSVGEQVDIIGYNLEHGPGNLPAEQADPVGSTQQMRALADQYGVKLAVGPDRGFALSDGVAMAAYADLFILQVQRVQEEPETVREFVLPLVAAVHEVAPDVQIGVQIGADGDVTQVISLLGLLSEEIDGISILTDHVSTDFLDAFLAEVRPQQTLMPSPALNATVESEAKGTPPPFGREETEESAALTETHISATKISLLAQPGSAGTTIPGQATLARTELKPETKSTAEVWWSVFMWTGIIAASLIVSGLVITGILHFRQQRQIQR